MNRAAVFVHKFYFYSYEKHIHLNAVFVIYMIFTKGFYLQLKTTRSVNKWSINPPVKSEPRQADESPWRTATPHTLEPRCLQNLIQQKKLGAMLWMTISLNFTSSGKCKRWCVEDEKHCSGLAFLCVCCQELVEFCLVRLWLQTVNYSLQLGTTLCISRSDLKRLLGLIICWSINKSRLLHAVLRCALSEALPGCDVVYNASAAVGHVLQRGVEEIKGWRVLQVVWGRVGEAVKKTENNHKARVNCILWNNFNYLSQWTFSDFYMWTIKNQQGNVLLKICIREAGVWREESEIWVWSYRHTFKNALNAGS